MLNLPATTSSDDSIALRGGLDLVTPPLSLKPGYVRDALHFEASILGGYTRIAGYERADGRPAPSSASYLTLTANVTGTIAVGNTITGGTSGATGRVIYRAGTLVAYTKATGAFQIGENIVVSGTPRGTVTALGGSEDALDFNVRMRALAADVYRADILAVPGSGRVRGVVYFDGVLYAFRNNVGATAIGIYKATAGGWTAVPMLWSVAFTAGSVEPTVGATITQGANSATVKRVALESGTWAGGNAAGRFIITQPAPGNFAAGALTAGGTATLSGAAAQIAAPLPNGSYEFDIGTVGYERRVYGADGVNRGFEFDGEAYVPITGGPTAPQRVMVHQGHLFFAEGNSVQHSGIGTAFNWTVLAGAGELLADGNVTVMQRLPGSQATGAAAIGHQSGIQNLYGTSAADFQLVTFEDSAGVKAKSAQRLGQMFVLDDRGVLSVAATQAFGNFAANTITLNIRPWIQSRRNLVIGSAVNREKNQYRLFFSDGAALYITIANGKVVGCMPMQFIALPRCVCTGETPDGAETMFFGAEDGFVYRLDAGTSFDGAAIDYLLERVPAHQGSPRQVKRYRRSTFEVQGDSYATFKVSYSFAYGSSERAQQDGETTAAILLQSARWDEFNWDEFVWDGNSLLPAEVAIDGSGENIVTRIFGSSALFEPFTISSEIITYSARRRLR